MMDSKLKNYAKRLLNLLTLLGFNPILMVNLRYGFRYWCELINFRAQGGSVSQYFPVLSDYNAQAGSAKGHYFHQDLLVATLIHSSQPQRHIDVGSRLDGFVAHVAAFRSIEVLDIRPLICAGHKNISFLCVDLMSDAMNLPTADSISCLHAIEHFGLGRYGDPIDPEGHIKGFKNLLKMIKPGGTLYISFPIGRENSICFNAHRIFHPLEVFNWDTLHLLELVRFDYVDDNGDLHLEADPQDANTIYGCGIYTFTRNK